MIFRAIAIFLRFFFSLFRNYFWINLLVFLLAYLFTLTGFVELFLLPLSLLSFSAGLGLLAESFTLAVFILAFLDVTIVVEEDSSAVVFAEVLRTELLVAFILLHLALAFLLVAAHVTFLEAYIGYLHLFVYSVSA